MSPEQREATIRNLARGDRVRMARAGMRREMKSLSLGHGLHRVATLVEHPGADFRTMKIARLLCLAPYMGNRKALGILRSVGIMSGDLPACDLSPRAREALAHRLREQAVGYFDERARKARAAA
jgi:hypothetical protein